MDWWSKLLRHAVENKWLDKLLSALAKKHKILLLGASGAGKTQFVHSLTEELPPAINRLSRTPTVQQRKVKLQSTPFIFVDTPGQQHHQSLRRGALTQHAPSIVGVINVVAAGYHEGASSVDRALTESGQVRSDYIRERCAAELELLTEWLPFADVTSARWIMTIVTKADLWWDDREAALERYTTDVYGKAVRGSSLEHLVLPYCSLRQKFFGEVPTSGRFDDAERARVRSDLFKTLIEVCTREA